MNLQVKNLNVKIGLFFLDFFSQPLEFFAITFCIAVLEEFWITVMSCRYPAGMLDGTPVLLCAPWVAPKPPSSYIKFMPKGRARYRILVIDDDKAIAMMTRQMLQRMGYSTVACTRPLIAITLFNRAPERFDAVIVDEMMPEIRGTHLAVRLLRIKDDIPIVLVTGHGEKITLEEVRKSGVRATLIKPVLRDQFQRVLSGLLK
jgi:CheY-like chemotaxis protein